MIEAPLPHDTLLDADSKRVSTLQVRTSGLFFFFFLDLDLNMKIIRRKELREKKFWLVL